jgi:hypothetical protein
LRTSISKKTSFRPSKWPRKLKPAKNSKLPKWPENYFEPFGKGGWPPISTWIISSLPLGQEEDEWTMPFQKLQGCYNINADTDDDPRKVNIVETEGHRDVEGPRVELPFIGQLIKIKKVYIGTKETLKLANVIDY